LEELAEMTAFIKATFTEHHSPRPRGVMLLEGPMGSPWCCWRCWWWWRGVAMVTCFNVNVTRGDGAHPSPPPLSLPTVRVPSCLSRRHQHSMNYALIFSSSSGISATEAYVTVGTSMSVLLRSARNCVVTSGSMSGAR
jgi:hypothetical protein